MANEVHAHKEVYVVPAGETAKVSDEPRGEGR
jgi:hypothetical protein